MPDMVASATRSLASWSALEQCVGAMGTELPLLDRCGYGPSVPSPLTIYLRNHEAAARAGCDLFRRTAANQRHKPYADELRQLVTEVEEDLNSLRELMRRAGVRPNLLLGSALRLAERVGRLKPNGRLLRRAPLSDLIEIEGLHDAVHAKAAGWRALAGAQQDNWSDSIGVEVLIQRAKGQVDRLAAIHQSVAADVLNPT